MARVCVCARSSLRACVAAHIFVGDRRVCTSVGEKGCHTPMVSRLNCAVQRGLALCVIAASGKSLGL